MSPLNRGNDIAARSVERWSGVWRQFLPAAAATPGRLRQTRRLVLFSLTIQFWLLVFLLFFVWAGARGCQLTAALLNVAMFVNLVLLRRGMSPDRGAQILCFEGWLCCTVFSALTGGWGSPPNEWYIVEALFAVLLLDIGWGAVWTLAGAAALAAFFVAEQCGVRWPHELTVAQARILEFVGLQGVLLTSYGFVHLLVRPHREAVRQVESLSEQLAGIEHDLAGAKQARDFSWQDWIKLDERRRQLEQLLDEAKLARRHWRPL